MEPRTRMTEPQVRYARTTDGVSIAYLTIGEGPPLLYCPGHTLGMQHIVSDENPGTYGRNLTVRTEFTIFDYPGIGASQRDVSDFSIGSQVRAIEAVAARLDHDRFTLIGANTGAAGAALYAAAHGDRVEGLACAHPARPWRGPASKRTREEWSLARRRIAGWSYPDGPVSAQRWYSIAMSESMSADVFTAYNEEYARADLDNIFRRIPVRTLFCVPPAGQGWQGGLALASLVPNCEVTVVSNEGASVADAVLEFMGLAVPNHESASPVRSSGAPVTAIILFADIAESTALTERMGDTAFRAASASLDERLRIAIREAGGAPVEGRVLGDGVMATFASASEGIAAALRCLELSAESELRLRIGIHAGDVIRGPGNIYGGAVNIAARICGLSAPGEVFVSDVVRGLARTSAGVSFEDRGERELKGVSEPVRVFAVLPQEH